MSPGETISQHLLVAAIVGGAVLVAFLCFSILAYGASRDRGARGEPTHSGGPLLQLGLWSIPSVFVIAIFVLGFRGYVEAAVAPGDAISISASVEGDRWQIDYGGGLVVEDAVRVPVDRPVALTVRNAKATTTLVVPGQRLQLDARPGTDGVGWLLLRQAGEEPLVCTSCEHADGLPRLLALAQPDFDHWRDEADGGSLPPAEYGRKLYARSQCQTCHSLDGTVITGPSFKGLFGRKETLSDGSEILVDAAYLTESILDPTAKVVRGFQPVMPPFRGQLNDRQQAALIAFIESQKP